MRPTQDSLFPLIEKYAGQYVVCLFDKNRKTLTRAILYSIYSILTIVMVVYLMVLGYGDGIDNGPLIFRISGIIGFIISIFIIIEFFDCIKLYKFYKEKYDIENDWLQNNRHAIVCFNCYKKDCPEIDLSFDIEAKEKLYNADYLVNYFYKRHMIRASFRWG